MSGQAGRNFLVLDAPNAQLVGRKTKDVLRTTRRRDWQCTVDYVHRDVRGRNWVAQHTRLRLIAIWDPDQKRHRQYLTSVPESKLAASDAPATARPTSASEKQRAARAQPAPPLPLSAPPV